MVMAFPPSGRGMSLARPQPQDTRKGVDCQFWIKGHCGRGASCAFRHDKEKGPPCFYFMKGECTKGSKCGYKHPKGQEGKDAVLAPADGPLKASVSGDEELTISLEEPRVMESNGNAVQPAAEETPAQPASVDEAVPAQAAKEAITEQPHSQKAPLQQQQQQPQQQQKRAAVTSRTGSDGLPRGNARQQRGMPPVVQRPAQQEPSPPKDLRETVLGRSTVRVRRGPAEAAVRSQTEAAEAASVFSRLGGGGAGRPTAPTASVLDRLGKQAERQAAATAAPTAPKRARWADRLGLVDSSSGRSSGGAAAATPARSAAQTGQEAARPARGPPATAVPTARAAPATRQSVQEGAPRPAKVARPASKGSGLDSPAQRPSAIRAAQGAGEQASVRPQVSVRPGKACAVNSGMAPQMGALLAEEAAKRRRRAEKFGRLLDAPSRDAGQAAPLTANGASGAGSPGRKRAASQAAALELEESIGVEGEAKRAKLTGTKPATVRASDNQASRKRKTETSTERSAEESAPVAPVTEDTGAQEAPERPLKATKVDVEAASGAAPTAQPSSTGARSVAAVEVLPAAAPPLSEQAPTSSPPAGADDDLGLDDEDDDAWLQEYKRELGVA